MPAIIGCDEKMNTAQFRSRERVVDYGEVYTSPREVNAMLDLVKHQTERIDSRFLEPACGHGNFLEAILDRKLDIERARVSLKLKGSLRWRAFTGSISWRTT
jgi:hypothetical protein